MGLEEGEDVNVSEYVCEFPELPSFIALLCVVCCSGNSLMKSFLPCFCLVSCSVLAALVTVCKYFWLVRLLSGGRDILPMFVSRGKIIAKLLMPLRGQ